MKTQCNIYIYIYIFLIDSVRTIRPSCNYVNFVYYYIDVCDSTLIVIFFSKTYIHTSFFLTIESR